MTIKTVFFPHPCAAFFDIQFQVFFKGFGFNKISFFEQIGRTTYQEANKIISLYEGNRQRQIKDGAAPEKAFVVPNGIKTVRFIEALKQRPKHIPPIVGLIGRVVPIKDIKTFIRAIKEAQSILPEIEGWIIGPYEEDPQYYKECKLLAAKLPRA